LGFIFIRNIDGIEIVYIYYNTGHRTEVKDTLEVDSVYLEYGNRIILNNDNVYSRIKQKKLPTF
jgi:hypothetical protein